jgi:hypothetical protein
LPFGLPCARNRQRCPSQSVRLSVAASPDYIRYLIACEWKANVDALQTKDLDRIYESQIFTKSCCMRRMGVKKGFGRCSVGARYLNARGRKMVWFEKVVCAEKTIRKMKFSAQRVRLYYPSLFFSAY